MDRRRALANAALVGDARDHLDEFYASNVLLRRNYAGSLFWVFSLAILSIWLDAGVRRFTGAPVEV